MVLESALREQAFVDGEAEGLEKLLVCGNTEEKHLREVAAVRLSHPPQSSHVNLFGLTKSDRGLVANDTESAG